MRSGIYRTACPLIASVRPLAEQNKVKTLPARIHAEVAASNCVLSFVRLVGVWSRKPV